MSEFIDVELRTITPDDALKLLGDNYKGQRRVTNQWVYKLADDMRAGRFKSLNGQTIVLGPSGEVLDGQHRLHAIVASGASLPFMVVHVPKVDGVFDTIDNGKRRNVADFVPAGHSSKSDLAALAKIGQCLEVAGSPIRSSIFGSMTSSKQDNGKPKHATRAEILDYLNGNIDRLDLYVRQARRMRQALGVGRPRLYGLFVMLVDYVHRGDALERFIDDFASMAPESKTVVACKNLIHRCYAQKNNPNEQWLIGKLIAAYEHYRANDGSTMLNKSDAWIDRYDELVADERDARRHGATDAKNARWSA